MKNQLARVVPFYPENKRNLVIGDLAEQIIKVQKTRAITVQEKILVKERNKIMRRLYHIAYSVNTQYSFPLTIDLSVDNKSGEVKSRYYCAMKNVSFNAAQIYSQIASELNLQGFDAHYEIIEGKGYDKLPCYHAELTVDGVKEQKGATHE